MSGAPVSPESQTPVPMIVNPVIVHTTRVSMKVCVMDTSACVTGSFVWAAAAAIPALPRPDSLEKMPRATPNCTACRTMAPANPPAAATGVKACVTMSSKMPGTAEAFIRMAVSPPRIYSTIIVGTIRLAARPMLLIPPMRTRPVPIISTMPVIHGSTPKVLSSTSAMEFDWVMLPMPKAARAAKRA